MNTFSTTRQLAAAPAAVFAAIENPARLAKWWGPNGFSNRFDVFEFQRGGKWEFDMIGPDGKVYRNEAIFSVIEPNCRVVIQHISQPHFQLSITLEPSGEGTLVRWDQVFVDATVAQAVRHIVEPANEQNLDRLSADLGLSG